ncbi:hypothetical protein [Yersinia frederiksenii]|uniref:hypothetical protein n=1 Tax=Yersinia frederiksenii TaxID=29484 RepID=UPI00338EAB25
MSPKSENFINENLLLSVSEQVPYSQIKAGAMRKDFFLPRKNSGRKCYCGIIR